MFPPQRQPARRTRYTMWSASLSLLVHGLAVTALVSIAPDRVPERTATRTDAILLPPPPTRPRADAPTRGGQPTAPASRLPGGQIAIDIPVPIGMPVIAADAPFTPGADRPVGRGGGRELDVGGSSIGSTDGDGIYAVQLVTDPPTRLAGPPVRYPALLRTAGIDGRVVLEFVVDTTGHVERESVEVIDATHRAFVVPARDVILGSRFRPGRLRGNAVRVRVRQVVEFRIHR